MVHVNITFFLPALPSSRFPQSVQNMREPIAAIVGGWSGRAAPYRLVRLDEMRLREKSDRAPEFAGRAPSAAAALDANGRR